MHGIRRWLGGAAVGLLGLALAGCTSRPAMPPTAARLIAASPGQRSVHLLVGLGQSNMVGIGGPISAATDPPTPRIQMWDWRTHRLTTASLPLSDPYSTGKYSPLWAIAQQTADHTDAGDPVVLLQAAHNGAGLVAAPDSGSWQVGYDGAHPHLYDNAITRLDRTLAAITTQYPTSAVDLRFFWIQGESDSSTPRATYTADLINLVQHLRGNVGDRTAPFTIGGMVPEHTAAKAGLPAIRAALIDAAAQLDYAAYVDGPDGGGDDLGAGMIHYTRQAAEELGDSMYAASQRAVLASPDAVPQKPLHTSASYALGTLTVGWSAPLGRFTGFTVEYRRFDGTAWSAWTGLPGEAAADTTRTARGLPDGTYQVHVATVDGSRTTPFAPAVYALHA